MTASIFFVLMIVSLSSSSSLASSHLNHRCICKCPDVSTLQVESIEPVRSVYIDATLSPLECECPQVVLPHLQLNATQAEAFCPKCHCQYESRNLSVMKVVVVLVLWLLALLLTYMLFLTLLEPWIRERRSGESLGSNQMDSNEMRSYNGVIDRVENTQNKWKRQVEIQRRNTYDTRTLLN